MDAKRNNIERPQAFPAQAGVPVRKVLLPVLFLCMVPAFALFAQGGDHPDYEIKDRVLVKYRGADRDVDIPANLGINRIGRRAFAGALIYTIKIPMGIAEIDEQAFMGCSFLRSVSLPNTLFSLGRRAFMGCVLLEQINIPISLHTIEEGAFINCLTLKELNIPDTVKNIGSKAFAGCRGLKVSLSRRTVLGKSPFMGVQNVNYRD